MFNIYITDFLEGLDWSGDALKMKETPPGMKRDVGQEVSHCPHWNNWRKTCRYERKEFTRGGSRSIDPNTE
jgi:hypothetical protein